MRAGLDDDAAAVDRDPARLEGASRARLAESVAGVRVPRAEVLAAPRSMLGLACQIAGVDDLTAPCPLHYAYAWIVPAGEELYERVWAREDAEDERELRAD